MTEYNRRTGFNELTISGKRGDDVPNQHYALFWEASQDIGQQPVS